MRRHRNPGFAPESLERKLSPSGIVAIPLTAEVHVVKLDRSLSNVAAFPARTVVTVCKHVVRTNSEPGDPTPPPPNNKNEPDPPDGNGTPPISPPSIPGGSGEPG